MNLLATNTWLPTGQELRLFGPELILVATRISSGPKSRSSWPVGNHVLVASRFMS